MSKVKYIGTEYNTPRLKEKHRASLRRRKSALIKKERIKKARELGYRYPYYVSDSKSVKEYERVYVPERVREIYHYEQVSYIDKAGNIRRTDEYQRVHDGYRTIPAHYYTRTVTVEEIPTKPYVKQYAFKKKFYKRRANKLLRRIPVDADVIGNAGNYKRYHNIWNEIY